MDAAPIWTNLKTFPWAEFRDRVDILTGGYPCQPFSSAGKRLGTNDPRHLWPFITSGIQMVRPKLCFFENVEGHISLGLREVISDLESLGYKTTWGIFSAAECGAPHQRKRVFILAYLRGKGLERYISGLFDTLGREESSGSTSGCSGSSGSGELANSNGAGSGQDWESSQSRTDGFKQSPCVERGSDSGKVRERQAWPSRPGQPQHAWEPPRVVEHSNSDRRQRNVTRDAPEQGSNWQDDRVSGAADTVGNTTEQGCERSGRPNDSRRQVNGSAEPDGSGADWCVEQEQRQAQPSLGGDSDGRTDWMDDAELYSSCDNRTDELRLLGNGVVPATAALAFCTLIQQL